jgi:hypothetical protein
VTTALNGINTSLKNTYVVSDVFIPLRAVVTDDGRNTSGHIQNTVKKSGLVNKILYSVCVLEK